MNDHPIRVPTVTANGQALVVRGRWIRLAVVHEEEWQETDLNDPIACVNALRESPLLAADILTFAQKLPETHPKFEYPMEWESVAAIPIRGFSEWWDALPQEGRKNVRRSHRRGVVIRLQSLDDELVKGIADVNNDSPIRQRIPFAHYGKTLDQVKKDQSSFLDRSDFICAYLGDELVGFLKLVHQKEVASILMLLTKASRYDARPANALIARAVERCNELARSHLIYGKYRYGNQPKTSLMEFKTRNGFTEVLVPRYYIPLTRRGQLAMMLKLHREPVGILPTNVIRLAVRIRSEWYRLKGRRSSTAEQPKL